MASEVRLGDCLEIMRDLPSEYANLIYADPPFFTQKNHSLTTRDRQTKYEFKDEWLSRSEYLHFLRDRFSECRRILKDTGSLFVQCDSNASHSIRSLLDEIFGENMFRSEIIWHYRRWSNSQRNPIPSHQTIYFYSKTDNYHYFQVFEDYSPATNVDQILQRRCRDEQGKSVYARAKSGEVIFDGHKRGVPVGDVWDIPFLNPKANERVGYPTQKPIILIERIIGLVTSPGDFVLDPFVGSGTTLVTSELMGRHSLGIDISQEAVELSRTRLSHPTKTTSQLQLKGRNSYIQSDAEALGHLFGIPVIPVQRNRGIDAILKTSPGEIPVLIRVQRKGEDITDAARLLYVAGQAKQPATLVLVATNPHITADLFGLMPKEVILINSTSSAVLGRELQRA